MNINDLLKVTQKVLGLGYSFTEHLLCSRQELCKELRTEI